MNGATVDVIVVDVDVVVVDVVLVGGWFYMKY